MQGQLHSEAISVESNHRSGKMKDKLIQRQTGCIRECKLSARCHFLLLSL